MARLIELTVVRPMTKDLLASAIQQGKIVNGT